MVFQPLVLETFGGWDKDGAATIAKIRKAMALQSGQEEGMVIKHLFGRLSILLMRDNASLLLNRVPTYTEASIDGII